jgi:CheY-like chemotaxis protein
MRGNMASAPLRVLVVDDWPDMIESMATLLRLWGHDVRTARDGPEALGVATAYHPDVTLVDVGLPGMDGYEVARHLREDPGLEQTFVVSMSGYGREAAFQRSRESCCDLHLLKPVDPDGLERLLRSRQEARQEKEIPPDPPMPRCETPSAPLPPVSPSKVSEAAESRLRGNAYLALKNISCEWRDGVLTLRGSLPSYYLKQMARVAVANVEGVERINDEIEVVGPSRWGG